MRAFTDRIQRRSRRFEAHPVAIVLLVTGTLAGAGCSLLISAKLDDKPSSTNGGGGAGGEGAAATTAPSSAGPGGPGAATGAATTAQASSAGATSGGGNTCEPMCMLAHVAHAKTGCVNGTCVITACDASFDDCDKTLSNGCEADLKGESAHCGSCANACSGQMKCAGGKCK